MTRAGAYGQSFALKFLGEGKFAEALAEAEKQVALAPADPEPLLDRAQIHAEMRHWDAAVADLERCIELDRQEQILDDSVIDDTLFSTLVAWGQSVADREPALALELIARYAKIFPQGIHHDEASTWSRRFRGEREVWVKER